MLYAYTEAGDKISPYPGGSAFCDNGHKMISKCGSIVVWHWAHEKDCICDLWAEHESAWHLNWKKHFPPDCVEISMERDGERHRADIFTQRGVVIELQHSSLSPYEILKREQFYQNMIWIFDTKEPCEDDRLDFRQRDGYYTFRWKHPRKHIATAEKRAYLDVGDGWLFQVKKMYVEAPCRGWGYFVEKNNFIRLHTPKTNLNKEEAA